MKEKEQTTTTIQQPTIPQQPTQPIPSTIEPSLAVPKRPTVYSMDDAIRSAIRAGKSFKLVRKVYQGKNGKFYYSYSIIVLLKSSLPCKEIRLTPYVGYVRSDDSIKSSQSNSSGYTMLNFMYDFGNGARLICREDETIDRNGNVHNSFNFYAVSADSSGVQQEYLMSPNTVGDKSLLLSAFTGFGGVRDWEEEDKKTCKMLNDLFVGYCAPGCFPQYDIENS